jgi:ribose 5-phosphate isomerase RpiB
LISEEEALEILEIWMTTPFEDGRHQRRIDMLDAE